jgi:hypothetical protein
VTRCIVRVSTGRHAGFDAILAAVVGGALHDETTPPDNDDPGPPHRNLQVGRKGPSRRSRGSTTPRFRAVSILAPPASQASWSPPSADGMPAQVRWPARQRRTDLLSRDEPSRQANEGAIVHTGAATSAILGIAAVFGVVAWLRTSSSSA